MLHHKYPMDPDCFQDASAGGSQCGRQSLLVIRSLLDMYSSQPGAIQTNLQGLTDCVSSQRTPVRFPSLMSQFRSDNSYIQCYLVFKLCYCWVNSLSGHPWKYH